jgi:hypothetical protein
MIDEDPSDKLLQDSIFNELRAFSATSVSEKTDELTHLLHAFKSAGVSRRKKFLKYLVLPVALTGLLIPSLAYAGLLPRGVSHDIKDVVDSIGTLVSKPVVAIEHSLAGSTRTKHPIPTVSPDKSGSDNSGSSESSDSTNPAHKSSTSPTTNPSGSDSASVDSSSGDSNSGDSSSGDSSSGDSNSGDSSSNVGDLNLDLSAIL